MCLSGRVGDAVEGTGIAIVVSTRGHPHLTTGICHKVMKVYRHGDAFLLAERCKVYDGNGVFLFSADNEREAREELLDYEEFAA